MNKFFAIAVIVAIAASVVALATRSGANASTPGDPRIAVLQSQVRALQKQVKVLSAAAVDEKGQIQVSFAAVTCLGAQTADLVQGTWGVVDQIAQAVQQKSYFGPQTQVNDYGNCAKLDQPKVPAGLWLRPRQSIRCCHFSSGCTSSRSVTRPAHESPSRWWLVRPALVQSAD